MCLSLLMARKEENSMSRDARLFCSLHFHENSSVLNAMFLGQLQDELDRENITEVHGLLYPSLSCHLNQSPGIVNLLEYLD